MLNWSHLALSQTCNPAAVGEKWGCDWNVGQEESGLLGTHSRGALEQRLTPGTTQVDLIGGQRGENKAELQSLREKTKGVCGMSTVYRP